MRLRRDLFAFIHAFVFFVRFVVNSSWPVIPQER
jgi:hypothetical protein